MPAFQLQDIVLTDQVYNDTFCFFHDCLGIVRFSLISVLKVHAIALSEQIISQMGNCAVFVDKTHHKTTVQEETLCLAQSEIVSFLLAGLNN